MREFRFSICLDGFGQYFTHTVTADNSEMARRIVEAQFRGAQSIVLLA